MAITNRYGTFDRRLVGTAGDDDLDVYEGSAFVRAGAGDDTVAFTYGTGTVFAGAGDDHVGFTYAAPGLVDLGDGDDTLSVAETGAGRVFGGRGADQVQVYGSVDAYGGAGDDRVFAYGAGHLHGQGGDDVLEAAGVGADDGAFLSGGAGNDQLTGGGLGDELIGGTGSDRLTGGDGGDAFRLFAWQTGARNGFDTITDFAAGDELRLEDVLAVSGRAPLEAKVRLVEGDGGVDVLLDRDGGRGGAAHQAAHLDSVLLSDLGLVARGDDAVVAFG